MMRKLASGKQVLWDDLRIDNALKKDLKDLDGRFIKRVPFVEVDFNSITPVTNMTEDAYIEALAGFWQDVMDVLASQGGCDVDEPEAQSVGTLEDQELESDIFDPQQLSLDALASCVEEYNKRTRNRSLRASKNNLELARSDNVR